MKRFSIKMSLTVMLALTIFGVGLFGYSHRVEAVGSYPNADIANYARTFDGKKYSKECRGFVNDVVYHVSKRQQSTYTNYSSDYFKQFPAAGAKEIKDINELIEGDIVQMVRPHLHTFIIIKRVGGNTFQVVDGNHNKDLVIHVYNRDGVVLNNNSRAFRLGQEPNPGSSKSTPTTTSTTSSNSIPLGPATSGPSVNIGSGQATQGGTMNNQQPPAEPAPAPKPAPTPAPAPAPAPKPTPTPPPAPRTYSETAGTNSAKNTWSHYKTASGTAGQQVGAGQTIQVYCRLQGFAVANGNTWWYKIASSPWNGNFYVSADAFYNNGATSGSLKGTPWYDSNVPSC